jgi:hemin uptake protein HemP
VTTFCTFFDLPQECATKRIDTVNENYYRKTMDRIPLGCVGSNLARTNEPAPPARIASRALLGERKEVVIVHNGREYRLRQTQNGKLILTA